jgi:hypothetical protein
MQQNPSNISITISNQYDTYMYLEKPLPFIIDYINELEQSLLSLDEKIYLSRKQKYWIGFSIFGIVLTNSVCWARFERISLKRYSQAALSWMFRHSKLPWDKFLISSINIVLSKYNIKSGVLALDDSDNPRSKNAKLIHKVHKLKDKKTGGYLTGQGLVMLVLISSKVTIPIGFAFYAPDPSLKQWEKENSSLKQSGVKKKERPPKPERSKEYPTKEDLALRLIEEFIQNFPSFKITSITADALYGTGSFINKSSTISKGSQIISQLRKNQIIRINNRNNTLETFFRINPFYIEKINLRGKEVKVYYSTVVAKVKAHECKKRKIVALKYEGEEEYRYLVVSEPSWDCKKIIQTYSLRWLVEVFFQDWKSYEGWGQLTKHIGYEGSSRGLILSLLLDHCLLLHPEQKARIEDKLPAFTVGSLREKIIMEGLFQFIKDLVYDDNAKEKLVKLSEDMEVIFKPNLSSKHMNTKKIYFEKIIQAA